ncbi:MAG: ATP-binding protein [Eubacteriaceae bacterium]|jgi:predicted AAA+ superfamily ATPase
MNTVYKETPADLCFYQNIAYNPVILDFSDMMDAKNNDGDWIPFYRELKRRILGEPVTNPLAPTPWQHAVVAAMLEQNPINKMLESEEPLTHPEVVLHEMDILAELYETDWAAVSEAAGDSLNPLGKACYEVQTPLSRALESGKAREILNALTGMIKTRGLGVFSSAKLFRLDENGEPVPCVPGRYKPMDEIVGCEAQKEKIIQNTRALINGSGALNTLLYGDMGTGKSSMVKALTLLFENTPLRFIEVHKGEFDYFQKLFAQIREARYPFILFIDDLSFESGDEDYKSMKNALEGSFEDNPSNMAIYATSNRRGLVTQTQSERKDAIDAREILEEKLSLLSRFGLTLQFSAPQQDDYLEIVHTLARKYQIDTEDEAFEADALQWALRHLNRSGRTAEQFIKNRLAQVTA